jgi:DNA-directed RNA polymerase I, II, and III subunit RPABC2
MSTTDGQQTVQAGSSAIAQIDPPIDPPIDPQGVAAGGVAGGVGDAAIGAARVAGSSSSPFLTSYERAKVIGLRAEQLTRGAPAFAPAFGGASTRYDACAVAAAELDAGRLPFVISRSMPDGSSEIIRLARANDR